MNEEGEGREELEKLKEKNKRKWLNRKNIKEWIWIKESW